jgi:hypothetical protein
MPDGHARATIADEITRLHTEHYGRGQTKAKTYIEGTWSWWCWRRRSRPPRR